MGLSTTLTIAGTSTAAIIIIAIPFLQNLKPAEQHTSLPVPITLPNTKPGIVGFGKENGSLSYGSVVEEFSPTRVVPDTGPLKSGQLIFSEEFNKLDYSRWRPVISMSGCGTSEFQIYDKHPENVFVRNGKLHIQPTLTVEKYGEAMLYNGTLELKGCNDPSFSGCKKTAGPGHILNPVISARMRTLGSFAFIYGKVEVKAKLPEGDWLWPAIWLNPARSFYGSWPMSGEVDIMEARGNSYLYDSKGNHVGNQVMGASLHFGNTRSSDKWRRAHGIKRIKEGFHRDFHLFQMEWTPSFVTFSVDNEIIARVVPPEKGGFYKLGGFKGKNIWEDAYSNPRMAPFDIPMYIILNVAVGGTSGYFNDLFHNIPHDRPWKNFRPMDEAMLKFWERREDWYPTWKNNSAFVIDYVKVWAI